MKIEQKKNNVVSPQNKIHKHTYTHFITKSKHRCRRCCRHRYTHRHTESKIENKIIIRKTKNYLLIGYRTLIDEPEHGTFMIYTQYITIPYHILYVKELKKIKIIIIK